MKTNQDIFSFILNNIRKIMLSEELISIDLSVSRLEVLALFFIECKPNLMMSDLAQQMVMPMSTATGIVDRLVKKGLLERGNSAEDRRVVTVALTESGINLVGKIKSHFNTLTDRVRNTITEDEFKLLVSLIIKVAYGLENPEQEHHVQQAQSSQRIIVE